MAKGGTLRWTEEELTAHQQRLSHVPTRPLVAPPRQAPAEPIPAKAGMDQFYALGRMAKGRMNKTEAAYAQKLDARKLLGEIIDYRFHAIRVRLADNTFYEPDFLVMTSSRELQVHETKGSFTTQAGQTKIKLCAEILPWFRVFKCSLGKDGAWTIQEFSK